MINNSLLILIIAQVFSLAIGIYSYKKNSISISGFIALVGISSIYIWLEEMAFLISVFLMFASSTILTKIKKRIKEPNKVAAKEGPRDMVQALANLGMATGIMFINHFFPHPALIAAFIGTVAAANADSWASEIGGLSKQKPVMITTFKPVEKGVSGGVTLLGSLGGVAGGLFIVATTIWAMVSLGNFEGSLLLIFTASLLAGVIGFFGDSYMGAFFQALYKDPVKLQLSEIGGGEKKLVKGVTWINNDVINFFATISGAVVAALLYITLA